MHKKGRKEKKRKCVKNEIKLMYRKERKLKRK